ncbi:MAG TPA: Xaa-Pro peptidase family protein [Candidatus Lustribacter sp.]|jgi:Xaa-Pro aminopeptidase|nr:Xaa-Pro peptidase family protein [Candidatus Lustribacter sp.]
MLDLKVDLRADFGLRLANVQNAMRERGLTGLAIYYGGQHNMLRMDPILYLTDYRSLGPVVLLVPVAGTPELIMSPVWDAERAGETSADIRITAVTPDQVLKTGAAAAKALGPRVALSGRPVMPLSAYDEFTHAFAADLLDGETIVTTVGATRTPGELERIEHAASIADLGFTALLETARVGMREYELAAEVEAAMHAAGAEDNFGLIAAGSHNVAIRPPTDRKLEAGDVIIGEITPCYRGYLAQLCRTYILGEPTDLQRAKYDMLLAALVDGKAAAKPGLPSAGIARAINGVIGAAGYEEYCKPPYMRTRGHGLGLGGVVPYDITDGASPILERNMTMVIHPNQYIPETGYMMCGDTCVIEDDGPRALTQTPLKLYWKEA